MRSDAFDCLARKIAAYSIGAKPGQKVLVDVVGEAEPLVAGILEALLEAGAVPVLREMRIPYLKAVMTGSTEVRLKQWAMTELARMDDIDAYVGIRADHNVYEFEDVPERRHKAYVRHFLQPWHHRMAALPKWVLLKYPTYGMAQLAGMGLESLHAIYFDSCLMDYSRFAQLAEPLGSMLRRTKQVRIVSPGTDLRFSIEGMSHYVCDGRYNLPDGEIFTAPVIDSVEGTIRFNVPSSYMNRIFHQVELEFCRGNVIRASCDDNRRLQALLDTDPGARRIGEFGIGLNGHIRRPMNQLLFDEKMAGSIHLALGQAFPMADNGNESAIHWDLVLCQLSEYGGGDLYFDGRLVRRDGVFLDESLRPLNEQSPFWRKAGESVENRNTSASNTANHV